MRDRPRRGGTELVDERRSRGRPRAPGACGARRRRRRSREAPPRPRRRPRRTPARTRERSRSASASLNVLMSASVSSCAVRSRRATSFVWGSAPSATWSWTPSRRSLPAPRSSTSCRARSASRASPRRSSTSTPTTAASASSGRRSTTRSFHWIFIFPLRGLAIDSLVSLPTPVGSRTPRQALVRPCRGSRRRRPALSHVLPSSLACASAAGAPQVTSRGRTSSPDSRAREVVQPACQLLRADPRAPRPRQAPRPARPARAATPPRPARRRPPSPSARRSPRRRRAARRATARARSGLPRLPLRRSQAMQARSSRRSCPCLSAATSVESAETVRCNASTGARSSGADRRPPLRSCRAARRARDGRRRARSRAPRPRRTPTSRSPTACPCAPQGTSIRSARRSASFGSVAESDGAVSCAASRAVSSRTWLSSSDRRSTPSASTSRPSWSPWPGGSTDAPLTAGGPIV